MSWDVISVVLSSICLVAASFLALAAGVGVLRYPDLLSRIHPGAKPQVLGIILALVGLGIRIAPSPSIWTLVLILAFPILTAPVSTHLLSRAGYRTGKIDPDRLEVDELMEDLTEAMGREADPDA